MTKSATVRSLVPIFLLLLALATAFLVYQGGLSGTFIFDDFPNIVDNPRFAIKDLKTNSLIQAACSGPSGPLLRPISMVSFAVNYYATGLDPFYFKITNLVIHLFNGIGIFSLTSLLMSYYRKRYQSELPLAHGQWISLAVAAAWLLHPFNLTSVLYIVQRMTSLSAFFSIWGLTFFVWGRIRLYEGKRGVALVMASLLLFTPLAVLSKENGALLPLLILVLEITLFKLHAENYTLRRFLLGFYVLTVALPSAVALAYTALHPEWLLTGYKTRDFTLLERVMTEARVLWFYIRQIILPSTAQMAMFHDDIAISRGLLQPVSTIFSLAGILGLLVVAFVVKKKAPIVAFGLLFFFAGHALESTVLPLEIAHEHRNYLPMYGIVLIIFFYLLYPLKFSTSLRFRQTVALLLISLYAFNTFSRANAWANPVNHRQIEVEHHPNSARANGEMGSILGNLVTKDTNNMEAYYLLARHYFEKAIKIDANDTLALFGLILLNSTRNKPIETSWLNELTYRLEHSPFAVNNCNNLYTLVTYLMDEKCKLSRNEIDGIFQASLRNPTLTSYTKSAVLSTFGYYLVNVAHEELAALEVLYQTVDTAPQELGYRLSLVNYLIALKRFAEAKEQLAISKHMDKLHAYTQEIELTSKSLAEQINNEAVH